MMIWVIVAIVAVLHACVISDDGAHRISRTKDDILIKYGNV